MPHSFSIQLILAAALALTSLASVAPAADIANEPVGTLPTDAAGKPLNFDFETGDLTDWMPEGDAFAGQPIEGDTVHPRRQDMRSQHHGRFWIGGYERRGDQPRGTLRSAAFRVTQPYATFLISGGPHTQTRVEVVRKDTGKVIFQASGDETENLKPVAVDLRQQMGRDIFIRVVDEHSGHWGHVNFDNFRFHREPPKVPPRPGAQPLDAFANAGLSPEEAAQAMTVPEGFRVTLFAGEPDVVQPIAQAIDDRGRLWVAEAYSYPRRVSEAEARDRILIFEDEDGDGHFDRRRVFIEKLNLVSGLEVGFGGVWVGMAPYLLFIPDRDGDDVPDAKPQVLLDGWGSEDTHETLNSFTWGPDGWLYGCHGVFTHSRVGKPGTPDAGRVPINAGLWRYHPTRHEFEVFAHGTSNPWGVDFNDRGQALLTACVIPHLYHMIQGGRYQRQAGQHFNPFTYADIQTIALHRHWLGDNPHAGNNRSDAAGGGHAHAGAMIYLGGSWPERYRNQLFMNNIHGARLNQDQLTPQGSGYVGDHAPDFLLANDAWSQIINLQYGPDGQMYMIDWYDKNQCHHHDVNGHDRTNGRIFKVSYKNAAPVRVDLRKKTDAELAELLSHRNEWFVRHARRILQERGTKAVRQSIAKLAFEHVDAARRLRGLWALHATGGLSESEIARGLRDQDAYVRGWIIQLALEKRQPSAQTLHTLADLATKDPSPVVRLYLASAADRLQIDDRTPILRQLVTHSEDAGDHNLPLMYWYAMEPLVEHDVAQAAALLDACKLPLVGRFLVRRMAQLATPESLTLIIDRLPQTAELDAQRTMLEEVNRGLEGKRQLPMPERWSAIYDRLLGAGDARLTSQATALALTFGDRRAYRRLEQVVADGRSAVKVREDAIAALVKVRDQGLAPILHGLLPDAALRRAALRALAAAGDRRTPQVILESYPEFSSDERRDALATLVSRPEYATALLDAVAAKHVPTTDLSGELVRQIRNLKDEPLNARLSEVWGAVNDTPAERRQLMEQYKAMLAKPGTQAADLTLGRAVFAKTCQQCHLLFGVGGKVGPDLTGSNRANLDYILSNVIDPSALIGKEYQAVVIQTSDGRTLTGIVRNETPDALQLATANETVTVLKSDIEEREISPKSMMPDDQLKPFSEQEVRSLVAYLASPAQTPLLATNDNVAGFFNGSDLTGWQGNAALWRVEDGEIIGKTDGLTRNEFLRSELAAGDFRLSLAVKLVGDQGNSGIQFRSEALEDGEMRGYQADVGPGWWGKLYEENGRGLLWDRSGEAYVKRGEWNEYRIEAVGGKLRTWINGQPCVDLDDASGARGGIFALQLHSGGPTEVRFKDLRLELLPAP